MKSKIVSILSIFIGFSFFACSELQEDITKPSEVKVHGTNAMNPASPEFHGKILGTDKLDGCKQCHASDLSGGLTNISCSSSNCHPSIAVHTKQINDPTSPKFHGRFISAMNYNMADCQTCHGNNFAGGFASPTCNTCHTQAKGPEACNTCHGDFTNPELIAPPRALNNDIYTTSPGVGAHTLHLMGAKIASNVECSECHTVPTALNSAGHIDNSARAELTFGAFTNSGPTPARYDPATNSCSNTYCHGNFVFLRSASSFQFAYTADRMVGNNDTVKWNQVDGSQATCGSCHGLPPTGHIPSALTACANCHAGVVDNQGRIIDKKKHIDGKINVFGN
ncbi:MAG: hypothetical protein C0425_00960 [Chlorobiaceae bacterium]|nr:hypothetical protein [Chlorobiaceae bacterium]MBA4308892.1 hypothetical protein [Chlorobiaceae bacterium]